jgi:hypothetical protein
MHLTVEFDREEDGRSIAEVLELPGVMVYGASRDDALARVQTLALDVLACDLRAGRRKATDVMTVEFVTQDRAAA